MIRVSIGELCPIEMTVLEREVFKEGSGVICQVVPE